MSKGNSNKPHAKTHKKNKWTVEEDNLLKEAVKKNGSKSWGLIARNVPGRTGKQCRERWIFGLDPTIIKDDWTKEEDEKLIKLQREHGNRWSKFMEFLPGRSSLGCKNRWSLLKRRSLASSHSSSSAVNNKTKVDEKYNDTALKKTTNIFAITSAEPFEFPPDSIFNDFPIFDDVTSIIFP
jgi:hypothetical protein